jgi:hypothetical protein
MPTIYSDQEYRTGKNEAVDIEDESALRMIRNFQLHEKEIQELNKVAIGFGLEDLVNQLLRYFSYFKNDLHMENTDLRGKNLLFLFLRYQEILISVRDYQMYLRTFRKELSEEEVIAVQTENFQSIFSLVSYDREKRRLKDLERNVKARKIQKWVQQRFSKWYKLVLSIFETGLKKKRPEIKEKPKEKEKEKIMSDRKSRRKLF